MIKKNITITALAAALVLSMAAWSMAGPGYGRGIGGGCGGPGSGRSSAYSQLIPEKQAAVATIYEKYQAQFDSVRDSMWAKHATLQAMINGGDSNEKKIGALTADISKLRTQMWDLRKSMSDELVKETGIAEGNGFASCPAYGQASCPGYGPGGGAGFGGGAGRGMWDRD